MQNGNMQVFFSFSRLQWKKLSVAVIVFKLFILLRLQQYKTSQLD